MNITINNLRFEAHEGETILDVALRNDISIPTLCHQKELIPFASCFICVVEVNDGGKLLPSCSTKVVDGMVVQTDSPRVCSSRKTCVELLLSDHVGDCKGPCQVKCPAEIDIPGFISLLAHKNEQEAIKLIKQMLPFPASLGRVCPRPCETQCRRLCSNDAVSICFLKRYIADKDLSSPSPYVPETKPPTGKKVAIVGAGPAGLSAGFYLKMDGYAVTVFDAHSEPGGMLRYGIPAYRLPRDVLAKEIDIIKKMGVEISCGKFLGRDFTLDSLCRDFDAVFLAIGAMKATDMRIEGESEGGALAGIDFLDQVANGETVELGNEVVVVGGGNTAIDAARTARRLGSKNVTILYRRTRKEMPASDPEVTDAEEEGVILKFLAAPVKMEKQGSGIKLYCIEMKLGEPDASGRRRPVPIEGSEFVIDASSVIAAIGQGVDADCIEDAFDIKLTKWNTLNVNSDTFETSRKGVFAGGDCVSGADIAVTAIAAGRKAARSVDQYLKGEKVTGEPKSYFHSISKDPKDLPPQLSEMINSTQSQRTSMPKISENKRVATFDEVEIGFTAEEAAKEASRCLSCACRSYDSCTLRKLAAEYDAKPEAYAGAKRHFFIDESHKEIRYESHKCIMCASCIRVCSEVKKLDALGFIGRGFTCTMRPTLDRPWNLSTCDSCMKCVPLCPTGALSLKTTPVEGDLV